MAEIRRLWMRYELDSGGVDIGAFHLICKELREQGLLRVAVYSGEDDLAEIQKKDAEKKAAIEGRFGPNRPKST